MSAKIPIHDSSGNVFADLGFEDAEELLTKSELVAQILKTIRARRLTQARAAELMGITQPKVSVLLSSRLDGFSTERLFRFLNSLGWDVRSRLSRAKPRSQGRVRVTSG